MPVGLGTSGRSPPWCRRRGCSWSAPATRPPWSSIKGFIMWLVDWLIVCLFLKSHLKTCQQVRPSPSMDWGQNPLALPSPCTGGRAGPDQIGVVWQMVWLEGGQINYNLIKELRNFWPGDVGEVHGFPNTWSIFSVSIANENGLNFYPVSQSLQRWQIGHNRLESPPGQTIPHAISLQALVLICHLKHRDTIR